MSADQNQRVLAALMQAGAYGITSVDFAAPNVIDGAKPIMRVAARIRDLKDQGYRIENVGRRGKVSVYVLTQPATLEPSVGADDSGALQLFNVVAA